jgi:uncharacterized membrane protein
MALDLGSTAALWLLLLVPLVWLVARTTGRPRHRALYVTVRSMVLVCLIGALAQPVLSLPASRVALIGLVDASHSVSSGAIEATATAIESIQASLRPDDLRILVFGARAAAIADTATLRRLSGASAREDLDRLVSPEATNLEQALAAARAEIPPGTNARILLFSDGHETEGDSRRIADRLAAEHVPVFARAMAVRDLRDTWIEAVRVPRAPMAEAVATLDVVLGSQAVRPVQVLVREGTRVLARTTVEVGLGVSTASVDVRFDTPGPHLVETVMSPATAGADALGENNTLLTEIVVEPRPRVLYVHADPGGAPVAARVLAEAGFQVTDARPQALPTASEAFDRWDVVLLSNLARPRLSAEAMGAIATWVEERGGGVLFVGGPALLPDPLLEDRPDYRRTELERVLPVTFEREDEPDVALVIVLDRSWSMNGIAMELSKAAAEAAANTLDPLHMVGVLTFNNQTAWDVPLSRVRDSRPTLHDAIMRITASGPTNIYMALAQAHDALLSIRARAKHLILLSDGQTEAADFESLLRQMTDARVTVSTVALGAEADVMLLRNLATWGGGRSYVVEDARQVPEIFVKEAKDAVEQGVDEQDGIRPVRGAIDLWRDPAAEFPVLQARNAVTRKPGAIDLLSTSRGDALLTVWPAGLGRTAMFAADVDGRWTRDWLAWPGFGSFLGTLVRSLAPRHLPARALSVTAGDRQGPLRVLTVALEARDRQGRAEGFLTPVIDVRAANLQPGRFALQQIGTGRYEARVVVDVTEPLTFSLTEGSAATVSAARVFAADHAAEYRFGDPDEQRLAEIAQLTGGTMNATAEDLGRAARSSATRRHPVGPWLLLTALLAWLVDIGVRRVTRRMAPFRHASDDLTPPAY